MRKIVLLAALVLVVALSVFSIGNAEKDTEATRPAAEERPLAEGELSWQLDTSPIDIDYYIDYSWFGQDWVDPTASRITEVSGVNLNLILPVTDDGQKLTLMMASGDLPEMITADVQRFFPLIDGGFLYDLESLMNDYAPTMLDIIQPEILTNERWTDGKTYYYRNFVHSAFYQQEALKYDALVTTNQNIMVVRDDYYQEIGRPDVSTPEKLIAAIEQMKANHPDKIGFYASAQILNRPRLSQMTWQFGVEPYYRQGNEIKTHLRDPKYFELLKFLNALGSRGLLTRDSFIDNDDISTAKLSQGDAIVHTGNLASTRWEIPVDNPTTTYSALEIWDSYQEVRFGEGWHGTAITKDAKNPGRAIRFLEFLVSDFGHEVTQWGILGDAYGGLVNGPHYHMVNGKPTFFEEYRDEMLADWDAAVQANGLGEYWFAVDFALWEYPFWIPGDTLMSEWNAKLADRVIYRPEYVFPIYDQSSEEAIILQRVQDLEREYVAKISFADPSEVQGLYDELIGKCENANIAKLEAFWTGIWAKKTADMGM